MAINPILPLSVLWTARGSAGALYSSSIPSEPITGVIGVNGRPTFFINGKRYDGTLDLKYLFNALKSQRLEGAKNDKFLLLHKEK
jgi:hypothetical protein